MLCIPFPCQAGAAAIQRARRSRCSWVCQDGAVHAVNSRERRQAQAHLRQGVRSSVAVTSPPQDTLRSSLWLPQEIFNKGASAGDILVDPQGPYKAVAGDIEADVFSTFGRFPISAK